MLTTPLRRLTALSLAGLVLAAVAPAPAASAAPPIERRVVDRVDAGASYDIVAVKLKSAPKPEGRATVVVEHDRRVRAGDGLDLWFDLDGDREPDVYLTGISFSEYAVFKTSSFTGHGKDISDRGCFSLKMENKRAVVRLDPSCLGPSTAFAVAVRSFRHEEPAVGADWVPRKERFSGKVLAAAEVA